MCDGEMTRLFSKRIASKIFCLKNNLLYGSGRNNKPRWNSVAKMPSLLWATRKERSKHPSGNWLGWSALSGSARAVGRDTGWKRRTR